MSTSSWPIASKVVLGITFSASSMKAMAARWTPLKSSCGSNAVTELAAARTAKAKAKRKRPTSEATRPHTRMKAESRLEGPKSKAF